MKRNLSILFVVLAITAIFASTAFAAPMDGKSVSLVSVDYNQGGIVLKFETSGLTQADLKNATLFGGTNNQNIYCNFVDDTSVVRCTVAKSLAGNGSFKVTLAGFTFWGELPKERALDETLTCSAGEVPWYSVDQYLNGIFDHSFSVPVWMWDEHEASGGFVKDAQQGKTYKITGNFCAPNNT
jgi:hypothetical protein